MQAASEETRKCPLDGAEMQKQVILGIIIDRCGTCKGVWLDGGELEQIKGNVEAVAARDLLRGMTYPI